MTEQEYIDATDLAKVVAVIKILGEITPSNSSVIPVQQYRDVMATVKRWEMDLFTKIQTYSDEETT
jgi:hypothetical protein